MKFSALPLTLLIIAYSMVYQGVITSRIPLEKGKVYSLSTKIESVLNVDRQIATLEFYGGVKQDLLVDYRYVKTAIKGPGFTEPFVCDATTKCSTEGTAESVFFKYLELEGSTTPIKAPIKLVDEIPEDYDITKSGYPLNLLTRADKWPIEYGILGLATPKEILEGLLSTYDNAEKATPSTFTWEYLSEVETPEQEPFKLKNFKLNLSNPAGEKAQYVAFEADDVIPIKLALEAEGVSKKAVFDNGSTDIVSWNLWEESQKALNDKACKKETCTKDETKIDQLPDLEIQLGEIADSKIVVKPKDYTYFDKDGALQYRFGKIKPSLNGLVPDAEVVLGAPLFSQITGSTLIYSLSSAENSKVQVGFGFKEGGKKPDEGKDDEEEEGVDKDKKKFKWWVVVLIVLGVLLVLGTIAAGVFYFIKQKKTTDMVYVKEEDQVQPGSDF